MDNRTAEVRGKEVVLVPYLEQYVETYHGWMQRPELLELTCSEPLTLEEERANQKQWLEDGNKCTFIILHGGAPVGDCNLFLLDDDVDATGEVEVEVMIAEAGQRRKGLAAEAVRLLMQYAAAEVRDANGHPVRRFYAKILAKNAPSIRLFEQKLGFAHHKSVTVFDEEHYCMDVGSDAWEALLAA
eukprot:TRINITY_DN25318_c0_g1_i1.p2 TRINITY_DN25318_c0_g1~~TRINITY_DN25318_c0_g1_i1.p2  ORF type:complete len:205 (+),score=102.09 TRINITY_DN25318_c0_g1_i1:60-617(+)